MIPDLPRLHAAVEGTWPPADRQTLGPVTIRAGRDGGKRVSVATATRALTDKELTGAENAMRRLGQHALFQVRAGDEALDASAVMARVEGLKTGLFGRHDNRPAAAGFAAIHEGIAVVHALEVRPAHRRAGLGRWIMVEAAHWASRHGAYHLAVLCTEANTAANGLYASMGFAQVGAYHYRQKDDTQEG